MGDKNPLAIVVEGDKALFNQYSVATVNPAQCPKVNTALAKKFERLVGCARHPAKDCRVHPQGQTALLPQRR